MKKIILASVFAAISLTTTQASVGDLTMPGERWATKFTGFVCGNGNVEAAAVPVDFAAYDIKLATMTTDFSLDNYLVKGAFFENGATCRYSAILLADNAAKTIALVESRAFSEVDGSECLGGKAVLDSALAANSYVYLHGRAAIWSQVNGADAACGAGATTVGLHFQVTGKI
jgi:hypothetical protein